MQLLRTKSGDNGAPARVHGPVVDPEEYKMAIEKQ
jgi:hypothetical protein